MRISAKLLTVLAVVSRQAKTLGGLMAAAMLIVGCADQRTVDNLHDRIRAAEERIAKLESDRPPICLKDWLQRTEWMAQMAHDRARAADSHGPQRDLYLDAEEISRIGANASAESYNLCIELAQQ